MCVEKGLNTSEKAVGMARYSFHFQLCLLWMPSFGGLWNVLILAPEAMQHQEQTESAITSHASWAVSVSLSGLSVRARSGVFLDSLPKLMHGTC